MLVADQTVGQRLRELREDNVMTLRELSEESGVSFTTIHRIEVELVKPQPSTLRKLARALGVTPKHLKTGR